MDEIILNRGVPLLVTPTVTTTLQNKMNSSDDKLLVSSHGDLEKKWITVDSGDYVKFATPVYFLQTSWNQLIIPLYETI